MLMFTGVATEITEQGSRYMLLLHSPRTPGTYYKVEADEATAHRMRALIDTEIRSACQANHIHDDEDHPHNDPFNRC